MISRRHATHLQRMSNVIAVTVTPFTIAMTDARLTLFFVNMPSVSVITLIKIAGFDVEGVGRVICSVRGVLMSNCADSSDIVASSVVQ